MTLTKRIKGLLIGTATVLGLAITAGTTATTAHATTWHKGTPAAMRGTWKTKVKSYAGTHYTIVLGKTTMSTSGGMGDGLMTNRTSYHHKAGSRYYYVRGHERVNSGGKDVYYLRFYKVGHKMKYVQYLSYVGGRYFKFHPTDGYVYYKWCEWSWWWDKVSCFDG